MDHTTKLLLDAQAGDRDALERFIAATQPDVMAICRYLGDPDNADDLAQETYRRAFVSLHRFRATGPAKHWLLTIARRTCADAARSRSRSRRTRARVAELAHDDLTAAGADTSGLDLGELIGRLDPDRRAAFVLTQLNGLSYDEAATLLDVPIGTIRSRVARAREQLIAALVASEDTDDSSRDESSREPRSGHGRP
jgi:RNA polymerase sigma-70 factor (ECF subfamily)